MSPAPYRVVPLDATAHDRGAFASRSAPLDRYLHEQVTQDIRRRVAACFVALTDEQRIAGCYTLASTSQLLADLPAGTAKNCRATPRCRPCAWGAWLWIRHIEGLGSAVLAGALHRSARSEVAAYALVVGAKDEAAAAFHRYYGFIVLLDSPRTLFLPLTTGALNGSWHHRGRSGCVH